MNTLRWLIFIDLVMYVGLPLVAVWVFLMIFGEGEK